MPESPQCESAGHACTQVLTQAHCAPCRYIWLYPFSVSIQHLLVRNTAIILLDYKENPVVQEVLCINEECLCVYTETLLKV